ncbi:hypothetical protein [Actinobacillus pleuropneumoniae]|uniref:Uncharacterized protein n=3 Tax=Actinobacillus pleuropneumoniae TaxID=715 RepID=A0A2X3Y152_ACTPL|nr:hypothetical protein [Actinobacillus pleuropneumoniae]ACE61122.1 hypothetical protein APP7_0470 [Actinobacillus pleuropneumoniae serovar 7 str. AP76]EFL79821.1 hypothetical protein APP6_0724 [Actinobacillus pleuropneumoniae serovar 6 str. Femo]EFM88783.1 hypothetical protein appser4_20950 [Actinobacillus pleuropneumoniae serovar 4 str. M62]EFM90870.1 hypothetical protein appser6_22020 [Actinobacillus pleuropneumoniae serovar 6 str. Femo]EFN03397.1 hypothetical protein appser13_4720 [Actinob
MDTQSVFNNKDFILCRHKEKRGNGFIQIFEAYENEETNEFVVERAMFRNGKLIEWSQSEKMNAEKAEQLWNMYLC